MSSSPTYPKRLIEVDLPIKAISAHARREKSIRHGHISTLHIWWARRPLAACRAVICASLWPDPADDLCPQPFRDAAAEALAAFAETARTDPKVAALVKDHWTRWNRTNAASLRAADPAVWPDMRYALLDFIADFANWDASTIPAFLDTARALTQASHEALGGEPGTRPLVVDPFAGGGSIPLEALRVGADAFASDLNPVAVLLNKVVLEYIPKYGQQLADNVRKWGQWVKEQAEAELAELYPNDPDGATPIAYLWARTVLCEGPGCGGEVPLMPSLWLAKKKGRYRALRWRRDETDLVATETEVVNYAIIGRKRVRRPVAEVFSPELLSEVAPGTSRGGAATCPLCGFATSVESVRRQLIERTGGAADSRLMSVVTVRSDASGRTYRLPTDSDVEDAQMAATRLQDTSRNWSSGTPLVPDGELNHLRGFFNVVLYGMTTWGDLFTPRQQLTLTTLCRLVLEAGEKISEQSEKGLGDAVQSCLGLAVSRHADINASLSMWHNTRELITHVFGRQALPMVWDYAEANTFSKASGSFMGGIDWISRVLERPIPTIGLAEQASATNHPLPEDSADAVFTDPPYYAAIPYADLSDFFYSWLQRTIVNVHPHLFGAELSPKDEECVSLSHRAAMYRHKDAAWFEKSMTEACREARRIEKPSGIGVFVFANKETSGWEAMLAALISSGWVITASWPIDTEMGNRLRARNSAVLASSIHLVCRPRETATGAPTDTVGDWRDVLAELPVRVRDWLPRLAREGVVGADAIFACLGPALEIFSRYARVEKANGEQVALKEYLEHVWAAVSLEALAMIFDDADVTGFEEDARLTAMWLWTLNAGAEVTAPGGDSPSAEGADSADEDESTGKRSAKLTGYVLEFDAARKIAQGLGAHLDGLTGLVQVKGDKARLLPVRDRMRALFGKGGVAQDAPRRPKRRQMEMFEEPGNDEAGMDVGTSGGGDMGDLAVSPGATTLDRVHQAMLLFSFAHGDQLRRFLVDDGAGADQQFWRLAQALSALYPPHSEEKRWVDGVLARKKALGV